MPADIFIVFLIQIAVMLACGLICGQLMRLIHQPAVLGEMIGGILIGPTVLGTFAPDIYASIFPMADPEFARQVKFVRAGSIQLGLLFFLFAIGLEIDVRELRKHGISALLIGLIGTAVPLLCGIAIVYLFPDIWGLKHEAHRWPFAMFIGTAMANTANPVLARILMEIGQLKKNLGAVLMTASVVDDLVSWSLLAVIVGSFEPGSGSHSGSASIGYGMAAMLTLAISILVIGRLLATRILDWAQKALPYPSGHIGVVIALVLLAAAGSEKLGVHAFFGPFLLGMTLARENEKFKEAYNVMNQFVLGFFVPIYFVSMGLTANFIQHFHWQLVAVIFITACLSKISAAFVAARMSGIDSQTSMAVGFGMNARGATGIILAGIGLEHGVIGEPVYVALVVMALATSIMAGPLMKLFLRPSPLALGSESTECALNSPAE